MHNVNLYMTRVPIIGKSPAGPGSIHDFKLLRSHLAELGCLIDIMLYNDLPD